MQIMCVCVCVRERERPFCVLVNADCVCVCARYHLAHTWLCVSVFACLSTLDSL